MGASIVDESPPLGELLDISGIQEICRSFVSLYGIGLRIFDQEGNKIADVRANTRDHCGFLFRTHETRVACTKLVNRLKARDILEGQENASITCFSGLKYLILPIYHEGSQSGRLIVGPYRPAGLDESPQEVRTMSPSLDFEQLCTFLRDIPPVPGATVEQVASHLRVIVDVITHVSYKSHITSRVHRLSMTEAFDSLQRANRQLSDANQKLIDLDRLKSSFVSTVSHELRTPLTSILGYTELLLEEVADEVTELQKRHLQTILTKSEQLLQMITQILDLTRMEQSGAPLERVAMHPRMILEEAWQEVAVQADKRNISRTLEVDEDVLPISVDQPKLHRVFVNLIANAVKFSPEGTTLRLNAKLEERAPSGEERLDFFDESRNRHVTFEVSDEGPGIPLSEQRRVFDAFYQVASTSTREVGGSGLGLAISKSIVESHDGVLELESLPGQGATFRVILPYSTEEHSELTSTSRF